MIWRTMSFAGVGPLSVSHPMLGGHQGILEDFMLITADELYADIGMILEQDLAAA